MSKDRKELCATSCAVVSIQEFASYCRVVKCTKELCLEAGLQAKDLSRLPQTD